MTESLAMTESVAMTTSDPILRFEDVSFTYDGDDAAGVHHLSLSVAPGEVILLCGDSGCGKTTVTRLINGLIPHYFQGELTGNVVVCGTSNASSNLASIAMRVGSVFQNPKSQFFTLNTREELAFACENFNMPPQEIRARVDDTAATFHIEPLLDRDIGATSGGQKQQIACAAVSVLDPSIMVLDEPSSNLDAHGIGRLRQIVATWKEQGKTVIIAEHRLYWLNGLIDRALYMADGSISREMTGKELAALRREDLDALGLRPVRPEQIAGAVSRSRDGRACGSRAGDGRPDDSLSRDSRAGDGRAGAGLELAGSFRFTDVQYTYPHQTGEAVDIDGLDLPIGQVTALTGVNGAGKTTFPRCLQGLDKRCRGELITPSGERLRRQKRLKRCFTVLQDVNAELFTESVIDEVMLAQPEENQELALKILAELDLDAFAQRHPLSLSGGQKQRVAIAAALASERPIIIFDEPTSGLDMRHMQQVAAMIRGLTDAQRTVVVVTHDPEFALAACDYNIRLNRGHATEAYPIDQSHAQRLVDSLTADVA